MVQLQCDAKGVLEMRGDSDAAGVNIAPMIDGYDTGRPCDLHKMANARQDIARREAIGQQGKIIPLDLGAVPPKARRVLDRDYVIDGNGMSKRCNLNRSPWKTYKGLTGPIDP